MKTMLSLLLLPVMTFAQPMSLHQEQINIELSMGFDTESMLGNQIAMQENQPNTVELFITVEIFFEDLEANPLTPQTLGHTLPKYLNTYSLIGFPSTTNENLKPQNRLNRLIASNDPMFPKENTMLDWLQPIRHQQNKLASVANIPEGFGLRIRF